MINQARTLLLNQDGRYASDAPGEQYVPVEYRPVALPAFLQAARQLLFGASPDRAGMNYRLAQYMTVLHATELASFVYGLDPRITYVAKGYADLFSPATFQPQITVLAGGVTPAITGQPAAPDDQMQLYRLWTLTGDGAGNVEVQQQAPSSQVQFLTPTFVGGLTAEPVALGASGYGVMLPSNAGIWRISCYLRPQKDLSQIVAATQSLSAADLLSLFGANPVEPYLTFRNLFNSRPVLPYQLGGLLLAVIYRTNEAYSGS